MKKLTHKEILDALTPKYNDLLHKVKDNDRAASELRAELEAIKEKALKLQAELNNTNYELNKARIVVGAEYLKGVTL